MKVNIKNILCVTCILFAVASCFKEPDTQGYLGEHIALQGGDTLIVAIGSKVASNTAWLDNSTRPVTFKIENVRDEDGNRVESFFTQYPTRMWNQPYDHLTDTLWQTVVDKLTDVELTPVMINSLNGQIRCMESTKDTGVQPGDVFHVDVSCTNSKGTAFLEDYVILKFEDGAANNKFVLRDLVASVTIMDVNGDYQHPFYDQINYGRNDYLTRRQNVYTDNGEEEYMRIYQTSATEPERGVKVYIRYYDGDVDLMDDTTKPGNMFDPNKYASWSESESYIDHGIMREEPSADKGLVLEFPTTPWPVNTTLGSYLRGPVSYFEHDSQKNISSTTLDLAGLKSHVDTESAKTIEERKVSMEVHDHKWPVDNFKGASGWMVRMRSTITFYEPGTYVIELKFPYTQAE